MTIKYFIFSLENIFQLKLIEKQKKIFTPASGHGNLNNLTAPWSSPVTIVDDVAWAQLIWSFLTSFGQIPSISSPIVLVQVFQTIFSISSWFVTSSPPGARKTIAW